MSDSTATLASSLLESASAVAALGSCVADLAFLDDASVIAGMGLVRDHRRAVQAYELALAAEIARRSDHTLGYDGLARRHGSATPAMFIQSMTGSSIEDATRLARLGQSMVDAADAAAEAEAAGEGAPPAPPVIEAAVTGGISVDAADAIRRGLGTPDAAVTAPQLADAAAGLIARADLMTPEALLRAARQARTTLDLDAIERGEKAHAAIRYVRVWKRDGMCGGSWAVPDVDGGLEIYTAMKLLVAKKTNGPRFADITRETSPATDTAEPTVPNSADDPGAGLVLEDDRSPEQVMADGFVQIIHNGLTADPRIVPGAGRAPVRVIVPATVLTDPASTTPTGSALLEETMSAITFGKLGEYLCEGGTVPIGFDHNGNPLNIGREQRLFTQAQRTALGVRDGGCRYPGCEKPPSWCEAHHTNYWARDHGTTDITFGILLCRYHHMLIHTNGWEIIRDRNGNYWLKPPRERDPAQKLIEMPSKNPLIAAMQHARQADQTLAS